MSRKNGNSGDGLILTPAGIIESLIRDEIKAERDLVCSSITGADIIIPGLNVSSDDYYNGAILVNVTQDESYTVSDYDGGTKTLTLSSSPAGLWTTKDKFYLKNINVLLDTDSFDASSRTNTISGTVTGVSTGKLIDSGKSFLANILPGMTVSNTTDGTFSTVRTVDSNTQLTLENDIMSSGDAYSIYGNRGLWTFARSLNVQMNSLDIINSLCYESHSILTRSNKGYRITPLGDGYTCGTLDKPMWGEGVPLVKTKFTSLNNIFTSFTLNYDYDYAKKIYKEQIKVDRNTSSVGYLDYLKTNCENAEKDYKVSRKWEYNADWIHDGTTAKYFLEQIILWLTSQRLVVEWHGDVKTHIQYEEGDKVYIDFPFMIPTGKETAQFMITGKTWSKKKVVLRLFA